MNRDQFIAWCHQSLDDLLKAQSRETLRASFEIRQKRIANFRSWIEQAEA